MEREWTSQERPPPACGLDRKITEARPLVSVVMTTYLDHPRRLRRAIDSVLVQSFSALELIVVFEPEDSNYDIVLQAYGDPRLAPVRCDAQTGMAGSFNVGLSLARGRYIARMDSDDYAYPERLERQVQHLESHPELALVGAAARLMNEAGTEVGFRRFPTTHEAIVRHIGFTNPMLHPTVMWDREQVGYDLRYDLDPAVQEDTELWLRLIRRGYRFANLPDVLIDYRQPDGYCRPKREWFKGALTRARHWQLGLKHPLFLFGIVARALLAALPAPLIDRLTGRNRLSDRFRSIASAALGPQTEH
jgi:glycosyltransferase involved in cell wall biosynthesis